MHNHSEIPTASDILHFWFTETSPTQKFQKDTVFDQLIIEKFSSVHTKAMSGELYSWRKTTEGRLAEIIVLDQFSRNMFRDKPESFASDTLALILAQEAINLKLDNELSTEKKAFLYMPFMHSESALIHEEAINLYSQAGLENNLDLGGGASKVPISGKHTITH